MDLKNHRSDEFLSQFPLEIRKNIQEVLVAGMIGLSPRPIKITLMNKPATARLENDRNYAERFTLDIPYAGINLQWEVSFCPQNLYFAPDFEFHNDNFLINPEIDVISNHIPSLANWDLENSQSLLSALKELLVLYRLYQMNKLINERKFANYYKEYKLLVEKTRFDESDVEVYIDRNEVVHLLIVIRIDGKKLPTFMQPLMYTSEEDHYLNPGEDAALLKVTFVPNRVMANLTLSPRLEQHLGTSQSLHIPTFSKESGLVDYVLNIEALLQDRINEIEKYYKLRNEFMSSLLTAQGPSIVEYDNVQFSFAALVLEVEEFYCVVHIALGKKFPLENPKVTLKSIYHDTNGKLKKHEIENYPYSPRWSGNEMVSRILKNLLEEIPKFKNLCQRPF